MRGLLVLGVVLAGCGGDAGTPDADASSDGNPAQALRVQIAPVDEQSLPFETMDSSEPEPAALVLERVDLHAQSLRAIGDAAPGDERTTRSAFGMEWHDGEEPSTTEFPQAPAGNYSTVEILLDDAGENPTYELRGSVAWCSPQPCERTPRPFTIAGTAACTIAVSTSTTLSPGGNATITVRIDMASLVEGIAFSALTPSGDGFVIQGDNPILSDVVEPALEDAWRPTATGTCGADNAPGPS